ncbi:hypothetical protein EFJ22_06875 [Staphylococcus capitis]|uniref:Uncharacterized protein n=2 Tax=Staphylococcus capitis TaxID=29388 RepID=A0A7Z7YVM3_STACP|nr:hypothetical protein CRN29_09415 [Staphylococcus capitis]PNY88152.1 hypothetical protein CD156_11015 [Staphylococcus capitis subsp. urealyticus]TQC51724.1 hypothetical protein EKV43_01035 [Staphylococcus sp. SKL71187]TQC59705.1 hypothetical protein EKV48_05630 [Staphylococcus sp. SKL70935]TQC71140.1 hypothetical protein EKV42_05440 [Staphylococcus sp. SKL71207]CDI72404.1 conserved membrane hypothetical protein [Staphylococcus capitis CR01]
MVMNNEDKREQQIKFEKNLITFPYLGFAIVVLLFNIFYPDIKVSMALFGLFFAYNLGLLFIAFIRHFKRTLILTLVLTVLSGAAFFTLLYVFGLRH